MAQLISGTHIRAEILDELKQEIEKLKDAHNGQVPGLVTIMVGEDPGSKSYVSLKIKTAQSLGFHEVLDNQSIDISEQQLLDLIKVYNNDDSIHGILVQLPLPPHIDEEKVLYAIDPDKDVDGFHPVNQGRLLIGKTVLFPPCTPAAIQEMIVRSGVRIDGSDVVVVGRSNIVGKAIANMLFQKGQNANATVTICHTGTKDIASHCLRADILIVAAGQQNLVKAEWIKKGACVIDVGCNRVGEKISAKTGRTIAILKGDVDFDKAKEVAGYITPVPGGVGPMTITMLMRNTVRAFKHKLGIL